MITKQNVLALRQSVRHSRAIGARGDDSLNCGMMYSVVEVMRFLPTCPEPMLTPAEPEHCVEGDSPGSTQLRSSESQELGQIPLPLNVSNALCMKWRW